MHRERRHNLPPLLLERARELRHARIPAEMKLWQCLRNRQLGGFKFRRNQPLAPFIADFFCAEANLVVELDGASHGPRIIYDARRTIRIERDGNSVIRFANEDVLYHLDAVPEEILAECQMRSRRDD
jgi:very-short-patch-repair endonuclease